MFRDLERETRWMFERAARESRALEGRRREALERRRAAPRDAGIGDDWRREERGEKLLPGGGVHRYYVSERVTTYGGAPARGARVGSAVGSSSGFLATCLALGVAATYASLGRKFFKGFDRTSYKEDAKLGLTARWPLLYASSSKFRDEFAAAWDAFEDARRSEAYALAPHSCNVLLHMCAGGAGAWTAGLAHEECARAKEADEVVKYMEARRVMRSEMSYTALARVRAAAGDGEGGMGVEQSRVE